MLPRFAAEDADLMRLSALPQLPLGMTVTELLEALQYRDPSMDYTNVLLRLEDPATSSHT